MKTLALITLAALTTVGPRSAATSTRDGRRTTAKVDGRAVDVSVKKGRTSSPVGTVTLGEQCNARKVAKIISREVSEAPGAFPKRSSGLKLQTVRDLDALRELERGMGTILSAGTHRVGRTGGATRVPGFRTNVGKAPPRGGSTFMKSAHAGATASFTFRTGKDGSKTIIRVATLPSGVKDETTVRFGTDGSSSVTRTLTSGKGSSQVSWTQTATYGPNGRANGSHGSVQKGDSILADGIGTGEPPQPSGGRGGSDSDGDQSSPKNETPSGDGRGGGAGENDEHGGSQGQGGLKNETPSGGGGGGTGENDEHEGNQGQGGPTLGADGSLNVPGFDISNVDVATVINWNRLGAAVTTPDPSKDAGGAPSKSGSGGKPCTGLDSKDFEPDPVYLMPNKQGWVSDPAPALLGSGPDRD